MPTPATPQTNKLVGYTPQGTPTVDGITIAYLKKEFATLQTSIRSMQAVMRQLEARIAALGG